MILWTTSGRMHPSTNLFIKSLLLKGFSPGSSSEPSAPSMAALLLRLLQANVFFLLLRSAPGASSGRASRAGTSAGGLLEEARGTAGSMSEEVSTATVAWAGTIGLVSSALALFATPEDAAPFLLWVLRPWASIRAASASISAMKEDRHNLAKEQEERGSSE